MGRGGTDGTRWNASLPRLPDFAIAEAIRGVVVDHADGLHECVADRRADEFESAPQKVLAQGVGLGRPGGNLFNTFPLVTDWLSADELPEVSVEAAELLLDIEEGP